MEGGRDKLLIQSGMTIVIPAWRIKEFLDSAVFEMARQKRDDGREDRSERRPRGEAVEPDSSTNANPTHREDFRRLLGEAAKKSPPDSSGNS
jgi:hypothetical protein